MISARRPAVSSLSGSAIALSVLLCGCVALHRPAATGDPLVITETEPAGLMEPAEPALLEEPVEPELALAARPEPRSAEEVAAIEAELELLARRQSASGDRREIAALEARAKELQRLVAAAQAGPLRP